MFVVVVVLEGRLFILNHYFSSFSCLFDGAHSQGIGWGRFTFDGGWPYMIMASCF